MSYFPERPYIAQSLILYTFKDTVDYVLDAFDLVTVSGRARRIAQRAVLDAYRELPNFENWTCLRRRGRLTTSPTQTEGTIEYVHSTREVTLTGATWPDDARWHRLRIGDATYRVDSKSSATVIVLGAESNPGANVSAGTSYSLARTLYPLPANFRRGTQLQQTTDSWFPSYVEPPRLLAQEQWSGESSDNPWLYTIRGAEPLYSGLAIEFHPPPASVRTYDFLYTAAPRPMRAFGLEPEYTEGTVAASGTSVTGTGTSWTSRMVGSVIRFGTSDVYPPDGEVALDDNREPFTEQRIISSVESGTALTLDSELDETYSGRRYSISDPVDLEPLVLWTPLLALAEAHYARLTERGRERSDKGRLSLAYQKIQEARGADFRSDRIEQPYWQYPFIEFTEES